MIRNISLTAVALFFLSTFSYSQDPSLQDVDLEKEPYKISIQDILTKAENIGSMQYSGIRKISTANSPSPHIDATIAQTLRVLEKPSYFRIEMTTRGGGVPNTVMVGHPDAMYIKSGEEDEYSKLDISPEPISLLGIAENIKENTELESLGTEVFDGKLATIVKYTLQAEKTSVFKKVWIWNEKGIPVKIVTIFEMKNGTIQTIVEEYKDFIFKDIPDDAFEVRVGE